MSTLPAWTERDWSRAVSEPFRSDGDFWTSLAASADALISLAAAIAVGVVLVLHGERMWSAVPFVLPGLLAIRAALVARSSTERNQVAFEDRRAWRDAERAAVSGAFLGVLRRNRIARRPAQRATSPQP